MKELDRALVGIVAASVKDAAVMVPRSEDLSPQRRTAVALIFMGWGLVIEHNPESFLEWIQGDQVGLFSDN